MIEHTLAENRPNVCRQQPAHARVKPGAGDLEPDPYGATNLLPAFGP